MQLSGELLLVTLSFVSFFFISSTIPVFPRQVECKQGVHRYRVDGQVVSGCIGCLNTVCLFQYSRLYQYCHKKKRSSVCLDKCSPSSRVDSVVIDIESECEKKDDNGSQPIEMKQSMINIAEDVLPEAARACGSVSLL